MLNDLNLIILPWYVSEYFCFKEIRSDTFKGKVSLQLTFKWSENNR